METSNILTFLKDVGKNNNREWFQKNKDRYDKMYAQFLEIVAYWIEGIGKFDGSIGEQDPKKCAFRIYRDVRFSKDKSPYKTNLGANISPGGRKSDLAGYYIHFQPGNTLLAGGIWRPSSENLSKIRQEIDYNPGPLMKILNSKDFKTHFGELRGDKLSRPPKGYSPDHENIEILKHKDYIAWLNYSDKQVISKDFEKEVVKMCKKLLAFNHYFNTAIS